MSDITQERERFLADIRNSNAETAKFITEQQKLAAEQQKLAAEQFKLMAERDKLRAEEIKLLRDRWLMWIAALGSVAAFLTALASVLRAHG
jgi:hypothetical protein